MNEATKKKVLARLRKIPGQVAALRAWSSRILVTIYVRLAHREEREAAAEFGETWRSYARATPRWFPRLGGGSPRGESYAGGGS
jgi:hypothetical protein